jgi:hypothetical protein
VLQFQEELAKRLIEYIRNCGRSFGEVKREMKIIYKHTGVNQFVGNKYNIDCSTLDNSVDDDNIIFSILM